MPVRPSSASWSTKSLILDKVMGLAVARAHGAGMPVDAGRCRGPHGCAAGAAREARGRWRRPAAPKPRRMALMKPVELSAVTTKSIALRQPPTSWLRPFGEKLKDDEEPDSKDTHGGNARRLTPPPKKTRTPRKTPEMAANSSILVPSRDHMANNPAEIGDRLISVAQQAQADVNGLLGFTTPTVAIDLKGAVLAAGTLSRRFYAGSTTGITLDNSKAVGVRWKGGTLTAIWTEVDTSPRPRSTRSRSRRSSWSRRAARRPADVASMTTSRRSPRRWARWKTRAPNIGGVSPALTSAQAQLPAQDDHQKLQIHDLLFP